MSTYSGIPYQKLAEYLAGSSFMIDQDEIEWTPDESWDKDQGDHYLLPVHPLLFSGDILGGKLSVYIEARAYFEWKKKPVGGWVSFDIGFRDHDEVWEIHEGDIDFDHKWITTEQIKAKVLTKMADFISSIAAAKLEMK